MSPVLVDTSVWRRYLAGRITQRHAETLDRLLEEDGALLTHPAVIGELVLGGLSARVEASFHRLPAAPEVSSPELLEFIRDRKLIRRGIGWVDCQLLASALVASASLWSADESLAEAAADLAVAFEP